MSNRGSKKQGDLPGQPVVRRNNRGQKVITGQRALTFYLDEKDPLMDLLSYLYEHGKGSKTVVEALRLVFNVPDPYAPPFASQSRLAIAGETPRVSASTSMQAKRPAKNTTLPPEPEEDEATQLTRVTALLLNQFG